MHKEVMVMGRLVPQPRLVAYQADDRGLAYTYSSLTLTPDAWSPAVLAVKVVRRPTCWFPLQYALWVRAQGSGGFSRPAADLPAAQRVGGSG